jgi:hypothetical protein
MVTTDTDQGMVTLKMESEDTHDCLVAFFELLKKNEKNA